MTVARPSPTTPNLPPGLRVSAYDRVAGLIIALLVIVGFGVTVLVLLWIAGRALAGDEQPPVAILPESPAAGLRAIGTANEMVEPGVDELAQVDTPQLADSLAAVTASVTTNQAMLDELFGEDDQLGRGQGTGNRSAHGTGGDGTSIEKTPRRTLKLQANGLTNYARMLDGLNIEMGVLGGGLNDITYVSQFTAGKPVVRRGTGDEEDRFYFAQDSQLVELDQQLLAKAGVKCENRVIVYLVPKEREQQLLAAELEHAGRSLESILQTVFGVRSAAGDYEFYVLKQEPWP